MKQLLIILFVLLVFSAGAQTGIQNKIIVAKDGSGDYHSIQKAIDATKAFPDKRITIYIKNGTYKEKIRVPSWNNKLSFIGEDVEKTIINYDDYFDKIDRGRNSTFFTFSLLVEADDFYAENLTIKNSAGPVGQAVALHVEGNRCVFKNCRILGNQDTIYLNGENSNILFYNCFVEGTTDFIFGSATAFFLECTIKSKANSYITAASTTPGKEFGFVFSECKLIAEEDISQVYLGRPWRNYAKTVFLECELGNHILPVGWHNWNKKEVESTIFYAEFKNRGKGSGTDERVSWSHVLQLSESKKYSPANILGEWVTEFVQ